MSFSAIRAALARLERATRAEDNRPATADELRAELAGLPVRPVVSQAAARLREFARELSPWPEV